MNKINSFYPTEVHEEEPHGHVKTVFESFRNRLEANIKETIAFKKKIVARQSTQCFEQLQKIREQSDRHRRRVFEQEMEFEQKIEKHIRHDIRKWNDYQDYFKTGFEELERSLQLHRDKNREHLKRINMKKVQLKALLYEERQSNVRISSLVKRAEERTSLTTKDSSVLTRSHSLQTRVKTESSLPLLKPSRCDRIKTIQSNCDEEEEVLLRPKRVMSYMEPIGTLRKKEQSSFLLLKELLQQYRQKEQGCVGDNWFLKVLFAPRHFNKLMIFLEANSSIRKVHTKL